MNTERTSSTKPKGWFYGILATLAVIIIALSCWLISTKGELRNKNATIQEMEKNEQQQKAAFQAEVDSLLKKHNEVKAEHAELTMQLAEKDSIIMANAEEIKQLLAQKQWEYDQVNKKVIELRKISEYYMNQVDILTEENNRLTAENERIREEVKEERKQNKNLQRQKDELANKVKDASALRVQNLSAQPVRFKRGGEDETNKAKKMERVRVTFTIGQNDLAEAGFKTFYIRIADPSKNIICKGMGDEYAFMYKGELLQYTEKIQVNYDNSEKEVRAYYIKPEGKNMQPGYYSVDIYDDNSNLIGQTSFNLK